MAQAIEHILLAVDLSENANGVIAKGLQMAEQCGATVTLLHVHERDLAADHIYVDQDAYQEEILAEATAVIEGMEGVDAIPEAQRLIKIGEPMPEIVATAQELDIDVIVIGCHARHGLQRILGSTTDAVLHHSPCDVYVNVKSQ